MPYICKTCGTEVEFEYAKETTYCTGCEKEITRPKDVMGSWTLKARVNQLKAMHNLMCEANDESIYGSWIYLMPDCPSEDDFKYIALDDEEYNECFDLFIKLVKKDGMRW